jgi:mannosyltransferase OCH1-like enzyme
MIPKIIHRAIPDKTTTLMDHCWNSVLKFTPEWEHLTHFDHDKYSIIKDHLPLCSTGAFRADLIRLEALYIHGGIYLDSDVELFRPIDSILNNSVFTVREDSRVLGNSILGAEPGNKFIEEALKLSMHIVENNLFSKDEPWLINEELGSEGMGLAFGPYVISKLAKDYNDLTILETKTFFPYLYYEKHRFGEDFTQDNEVFGAHHWAGSWLPAMSVIEGEI